MRRNTANLASTSSPAQIQARNTDADNAHISRSAVSPDAGISLSQGEKPRESQGHTSTSILASTPAKNNLRNSPPLALSDKPITGQAAIIERNISLQYCESVEHGSQENIKDTVERIPHPEDSSVSVNIDSDARSHSAECPVRRATEPILKYYQDGPSEEGLHESRELLSSNRRIAREKCATRNRGAREPGTTLSSILPAFRSGVFIPDIRDEQDLILTTSQICSGGYPGSIYFVRCSGKEEKLRYSARALCGLTSMVGYHPSHPPQPYFNSNGLGQVFPGQYLVQPALGYPTHPPVSIVQKAASTKSRLSRFEVQKHSTSNSASKPLQHSSHSKPSEVQVYVAEPSKGSSRAGDALKRSDGSQIHTKVKPSLLTGDKSTKGGTEKARHNAAPMRAAANSAQRKSKPQKTKKCLEAVTARRNTKDTLSLENSSETRSLDLVNAPESSSEFYHPTSSSEQPSEELDISVNPSTPMVPWSDDEYNTPQGDGEPNVSGQPQKTAVASDSSSISQFAPGSDDETATGLSDLPPITIQPEAIANMIAHVSSDEYLPGLDNPHYEKPVDYSDAYNKIKNIIGVMGFQSITHMCSYIEQLSHMSLEVQLTRDMPRLLELKKYLGIFLWKLGYEYLQHMVENHINDQQNTRVCAECCAMAARFMDPSMRSNFSKELHKSRSGEKLSRKGFFQILNDNLAKIL